jgi:uncharacterized protein (DUF302 family)
MEKLRNRSGLWMQVSISFEGTNEKGLTKEIREQYVVEAATFIDCETNIRKEMEYNNRPIKVTAITKPKYGTICFNTDSAAENWYKCKVCITEEVEVRTRKGGVRTKTKVVSHYHLVQAIDVDDARRAIKDAVYQYSTEDYEISDIVKTKILDVLENGEHLKTLGEEKE